MKSYAILGSVLLLVITLTAGCGNNSVPSIAPPNSQYPNGYYGGTASCGAVPSGTPLHPDGSPYQAMLTPYYQGGSNSNSLTLYLSYYSSPNADNSIQNIVGNGTFNFADQALFLPQGSATGSTAICVSSANQSGNVTPGVYQSGGIISLVLDGFMQAPSVSPYGAFPSNSGYPTGFGQVPIEIAIGTGSQAYLVQSRIAGMVQVTINSGNYNAPVLQYQAQ